MDIKVVSFNLRCRSDFGGNSIKERSLRLNEILKNYDADLIGFQECSPRWKKKIKKYFCKEYGMFSRYRGLFQREATPVLWKQDKFSFIDSGCFWLSDTPWKPSGKWDEKLILYRICTYVILEERESKKRITFFNTHFGFGDSCQQKSAALIYEYSKKITEGPLVITGDFNMTPGSKGYIEMTEHFTDANSMTVKTTSPTYHGYGKGKPCHIDYCFTDKKFLPVDYKIIDETVDGKYPSDHYGIYVKVRSVQ